MQSCPSLTRLTKKFANSFSFMAVFLILIGCGESGPSRTVPEENVPATERNRGRLSEQGANVQLQQKRKIRLDSEGQGFIQSLFDLKFKNDRFYALDRLGAAITLFDSSGTYLRSIPVAPEAGADRLLTELLVTNEGEIYVKDERLRTIFQLNSQGKVISKWHGGDTPEAAQITVGGLVVVPSDSGRVLYTTIFTHLSSRNHLRDSFLIGAYDQEGSQLTQFAKHHPKYQKFNLINFFVSAFAIWQNELYLLESASHEIRVYSLVGELRRSFGEPGYHQKVIDRGLKANPTLPETKAFVLSYSAFDEIFVVPHLKPFSAPLIAVTYRTPIVSETDPTEATGSDYYLMLYEQNGNLLLNDLKLPGKLFDVVDSEDTPLFLINVDNTPVDRRVGLYSLQIDI